MYKCTLPWTIIIVARVRRRCRPGAYQKVVSTVIASSRVRGAKRVPASMELIRLLALGVVLPIHRPAIPAVHERNYAEDRNGDEERRYNCLARLQVKQRELDELGTQADRRRRWS